MFDYKRHAKFSDKAPGTSILIKDPATCSAWKNRMFKKEKGALGQDIKRPHHIVASWRETFQPLLNNTFERSKSRSKSKLSPPTSVDDHSTSLRKLRKEKERIPRQGLQMHPMANFELALPAAAAA